MILSTAAAGVSHVPQYLEEKKKYFRNREKGEMFAVLCVSQQFLADECRAFMCQAPGQTANNEGLMDSLYPTTTEMIPTILELLQAFLKKR